MFDDILSDINGSLQNELRTTKKQKRKLNHVLFKNKGLSIFSLCNEKDKSADLYVTTHYSNGQEIYLRRPIIQDEIDLFGTKYARLCSGSTSRH